MNINIEMVVSIILAVFASGGFWSFLQARHTKKDVKAQAILALLHDKLFYLCEKHLQEKKITIEEFENLTCLYEPYCKLDGNGTVEALYEKVKQLSYEDK